MSRARNLMKIRGLMIAFSILVMIAGITGTVLQGGFNLGIDFRPGISQTVYIEDRVTTAQVRDTLSNFDGIQIQRLGDSAENRFTIRLRDDGTIQNFEREMAIAILTQLQEKKKKNNKKSQDLKKKKKKKPTPNKTNQ